VQAVCRCASGPRTREMLQFMCVDLAVGTLDRLLERVSHVAGLHAAPARSDVMHCTAGSMVALPQQPATRWAVSGAGQRSWRRMRCAGV